MGEFYLGVDIGSVALKAVLLSTKTSHGRLPAGFSQGVETAWCTAWFSPYIRTKGRPAEAAGRMIDAVVKAVGSSLLGVRLTGAAAEPVAKSLDVAHENEFIALAKGISLLHLDTRTVFEMGGETSKYLRLEAILPDGTLSVVDYETNGDCAAGTGAFIDQQAGRLGFDVEKIGDLVKGAERIPKIAGRCSVFAKSDMIHAQQKGYDPHEVLAGLCEAVAKNFKGAVIRNKHVVPPVLFVGGVAANSAVAESLRSAFDLEPHQFHVPQYHAWIGAAGAAAAEAAAPTSRLPGSVTLAPDEFTTLDPLDMQDVILLRDRVPEVELPKRGEQRPVYLGIDVGSVSTNLAVIDGDGSVLWELYVRTRARPIEVVSDGLEKLARELGDRVHVGAVGTTGSGRELIGQLVGADTVNDEITAHQRGASFIAERYLDSKVNTILEIGGQDSKYIRIEDGVVVDFTMNEACAAGTGSFLEERAVELGISIKDEFASMALASRNPVRLGERCTVFMERDVFAHLRKGALIPDLVAGLAYSVVMNYINRVVRGRSIDGVIFFQGGTAYNDAVAAAFSSVLGQKIVVPPHNGVMGAIGAALLAREWARSGERKTRFRGLCLERVPYSMREFTCPGCENYCNIQEFTVEGERSYWGDQCSERYRKRQKTSNIPVTDDLFSRYLELLPQRPLMQHGPTVGIPNAMYAIELLPFWYAFFERLGWSIMVSPPTNKRLVERGLESTVAEPCFPITVAHGHASWLLEQGVDAVFVPVIIDRKTPQQNVESFTCVWGQTLPYVLRASSALAGLSNKLISPILWFRRGRSHVRRALSKDLARFGVSRKEVDRALEHAQRVQADFVARLHQAGKEALGNIRAQDQRAIVLLGRPYSIYDRRVSLSVAPKLRDYYGIDVIPMDFLDVDSIDISDVNPNMFWNYGRKIIAAAKLTRNDDLLHVIHVTNFKCGPDSFIKHYLREAGGKPFLTLQFDGHANDAGIMTRCEAFLESKGMLKRTSAEVPSTRRKPEAA